jgi:hypothetical protein
MYGRINIGGKNYIERFWTYTNITTLTANQILTSRIVLDGEADFLLKLNTCSSTGDFRIRIGTSDSGIWFSSAGNVSGGGNDRVLSTLIMGNGQFPFPVVPHIWFPRSAALIMDLQDISGSGNTLEFAFHGSKLIQE